MKLSAKQLKRIIKEEVRNALQEAPAARKVDFSDPGGTYTYARPGQDIQKRLKRYLRLGRTGRDVKMAQHLLQQAGYFAEGQPVDGKFTPYMKTEVKEFQRASGLSTDGIIGPKTWGKLRAAGAAPSKTTGPQAISKGAPIDPAAAGKLRGILQAVEKMIASGTTQTGLHRGEGRRYSQKLNTAGNKFQSLLLGSGEAMKAAKELIKRRADKNVQPRYLHVISAAGGGVEALPAYELLRRALGMPKDEHYSMRIKKGTRGLRGPGTGFGVERRGER